MPQKNRIFAIFRSQSIRQAPTKIPEEPLRKNLSHDPVAGPCEHLYRASHFDVDRHFIN